MTSNIFRIKRNKEINLLPQLSVGIFWTWQLSATYKPFSTLIIFSTSGVTYLLQYHVTSRSFIASQQASDGGIFGPSF
jgi:hypothetical protein